MNAEVIRALIYDAGPLLVLLNLIQIVRILRRAGGPLPEVAWPLWLSHFATFLTMLTFGIAFSLQVWGTIGQSRAAQHWLEGLFYLASVAMLAETVAIMWWRRAG